METANPSTSTKAIFALFGKPVVQGLLVVVASLIVYSNTFLSPFALDDGLYITENPIIKDLRYFLDPASANGIAPGFGYQTLKMRYVGMLTFALNYHLGGIDVIGYHVINVIIHVINALLVYWLIILTFETPFFFSLTSKPQSHLIAFYSSLIFAIHPIQTQAVTYITQRFASLATMFCLLAVVLYIRWRNTSLNPNNDSNGPKGKVKTIFLYLGSLLSAVLAMKTKEIAFTLPVIIAIYEFMFFRGKGARRALYLIPLLLTMLIIPASLLGIDRPIGDIIGDVDRATRAEISIPRTAYLLTEFRVIATYLRLLFLPINQNLDYDFPVYTSFSDPRVWLSFLCLFSIFSFAVYLFYRSRIPSGPLNPDSDGLTTSVPGQPAAYFRAAPLRLISFGLFWFFITLSVESSLISTVDVIFEHRLYLPSFGISLAFVSAMFYITDISSSRFSSCASQTAIAARNLFLVAVITALSIAAYHRNMVWNDAITLWEDVAKKSPQKTRAHNNLGKYYIARGQSDKAIPELQYAIKLDPAYDQARGNLIVAYINNEMWEDAQKEALTLLNLAPTNADPRVAMGVIYINKNMIDEAIDYLQQALALDPRHILALIDIGIAYANKGWNDKAMEAYNQAIAINPSNPDAYYNRGNLFFDMKNHDLANKDYQMACKLGSKNGCDAGATMDKH